MLLFYNVFCTFLLQLIQSLNFLTFHLIYVTKRNFDSFFVFLMQALNVLCNLLNLVIDFVDLLLFLHNLFLKLFKLLWVIIFARTIKLTHALINHIQSVLEVFLILLFSLNYFLLHLIVLFLDLWIFRFEVLKLSYSILILFLIIQINSTKIFIFLLVIQQSLHIFWMFPR